MGQIGFFDLSKRYAGLDAKNEPLAKIDEVVPWEDFRGCLDAVCRRPDKARKSRAGRKPWDAVVMFKTIILSALYNLSDDQVEHQIRDRLSFMRFLGLGLEDRVPDAKTVWQYREQLTQAGVIETLFETFDGHLKDLGYLAMGGQIIDASIVAMPKQRNSRKENAGIKAGETPECWQDKPAKRRQKDVEARWTKKHGRSHYGYKNHVNVDRRHKLVRRYQVKAAATRILGATWQRCRVHFARNLLAHAGGQGRRVVSAFVATAFAQEDADSAKVQWRQVADQLRPKVPKLAVLMDEAEHDVLAYMSFPKEHRQKLHSTNPIERLHAEVKRRTNVVGIFPNEDAITRLVGAILLEQNDEWAVSRRYMTLESIAPLGDGVPITLPTVAACTSRPYPPGAA